MIYNVIINTDNDAFDPDPSGEIARILNDVAVQLLAEGPQERSLKDIYDKKVGMATYIDM